MTARLGLVPTDAWNVGDIDPRTGQPRKFMSWQLKSGLDDTRPLDEHIKSLLLIVGVQTSEMRQLWVDHDLWLQCVGYYPPSSGAGMHFDREVVRQAAQLGLAIDCDHYFVDDHDHGP
ncbi:MAG TPA: DUF4279 domain-containing protein [Planctomycetota bacterium]|nr:DUF4279 domain-containing protein [Planctomycetota bacterium]